MIDGIIRRAIDPFLDRIGRQLARAGISADFLTGVGFVFGLASAWAIVVRWDEVALFLFFANRLLDGLDGATARSYGSTDRGGFLDIVLDFAVYGLIPLSFALREPAGNALAAASLLFSFYVNGATFLAFAAIAARRGMDTQVRGAKSIYFTAGLAEGTETILAFVAMIVWPELFSWIAGIFAGLTLVTAIARIALAVRMFEDEKP